MNYSPELNRKLELYASGWLEGRELQDFERMLESDSDLRKEALFRKSVVEAIREVRQQELYNFIMEKATVRLASNPWGKVWTVASIVIIGIAVAFYFIDFNKFSSEEKSSAEKPPPPVISSPIITQNEITDSITNNEDTLLTSIQENRIPEKEYNQKAEDTTTVITETLKGTDSAETDLENGEEIIVKRDELLATINLKPIDRSAVKHPEQENLSSTTIEKLNPEAKLPDPPSHTETFRVELWKSPINFKGYRLVKNRLTLFGVEQNVILRLYKIDETYYLEYEPNTFSKLYPGDQFNAFVRVRDPEIVSQLAQ